MQILLGGFNTVTNQDLVNRGFKPRLRYETVERNGQLSEHLKCLYCGENMIYDFKERDRFIKEGRWDFRKDRPLHCGDSTCKDWIELYEKDKVVKMEMLFDDLLKKKLIS